jgi:hypothetical protein
MDLHADPWDELDAGRSASRWRPRWRPIASALVLAAAWLYVTLPPLDAVGTPTRLAATFALALLARRAYTQMLRRGSARPFWSPWIAACALAFGVAALYLGEHRRVDAANRLAVGYGLATSASVATRADRCVAIIMGDYDAAPAATKRNAPRALFARVVPKVCAIGVERGMVAEDGAVSEKDSYAITTEVLRSMGLTR